MPEITKEQRDELQRLRSEIAEIGSSGDGRFEELAYELMPALLDAADEACRFYRADGSHEELPPDEVKRRRIGAAKRLADYERLREELRKGVQELREYADALDGVSSRKAVELADRVANRMQVLLNEGEGHGDYDAGRVHGGGQAGGQGGDRGE